MNIKQLRQQKVDTLAKAKAISALAGTENRTLTEAEGVEFDATMSQVTKIQADVERAERLLDMERSASGTAVVEVGVDLATKKPWANFGEQLIAVRNAAVSPRNTDVRLLAALGSNESVPAEGGFLVEPEFAKEIWQRTYDVGLVSKRCFDMSMKTNRLVMNAVDEDSRVDGQRWGGLLAYWEGESNPYQGVKPKFRQMQLVANKLTGLCYITEEQLEDADATQKYIDTAFPEEFAFRIDDAILNGTGAGMPLGVQTSNAPIVVAPAAADTNHNPSTADILQMWSQMWARSRKNACWFINQQVEPGLYPLTLGSPSLGQILMYTPPGINGNNSGYGLLMGKPVIPVEQASALGTQGDILLADMSQYLLARKGGIRADSSMHVAFLTGEMAFRFMLRLDGQPLWKKPLTPKNGTTLLSAFITLGAR
ncbi:MAG: phage major capsid protein [Acidobacteriaceae bacterium]